MRTLRWLGVLAGVVASAVVKAVWGETAALGAFLLLVGIIVGYALAQLETLRERRTPAAASKGGI